MHGEVSIYTVYTNVEGPFLARDRALLRMLENKGVRLPIGRIAFEAHRKTFEKITAEIENLWLILEYDGCYNVMKGGRYLKFGSIKSAERYIERVSSGAEMI